MGLEDNIKTETQKIHVGDVLGDFVEKYETFIRPALKKGQLKLVVPVILDVCLRFGATESYINFPHPKIYANYRMALTYLKGYVENLEEAQKHFENERMREELLLYVDRQVGEVDLAMTGLRDERYLKWREKFKDLIAIF